MKGGGPSRAFRLPGLKVTALFYLCAFLIAVVWDNLSWLANHWPGLLFAFLVVGVPLVIHAYQRRRLPELLLRLGDPESGKWALSQLLKKRRRALPILIRALTAPPLLVMRTNYDPKWDRTLARRLAAQGLGRLKDSGAVEALTEVLDDRDQELRAKAIWALAEIHDPRAVPALLPLLGDGKPAEGHPIGVVAAEALRNLGQGNLVRTFFRTLEGDGTALGKLRAGLQPGIARGFARALGHPDTTTATHAAWALGELGAVEALPDLRSKVGMFSSAPPEVREACARAVSRLEASAALPRPAEAEASTTETLPRMAEALQPSTDTLPRVPDDTTMSKP